MLSWNYCLPLSGGACTPAVDICKQDVKYACFKNWCQIHRKGNFWLEIGILLQETLTYVAQVCGELYSTCISVLSICSDEASLKGSLNSWQKHTAQNPSKDI